MDHSEQLLYSTIRIEADLPDGNYSTGTGFFFTFSNPIGDIPVIITNKHVVEDAISLTFCCRAKNEDGSPDLEDTFKIYLDEALDEIIVMHPEEEIDLVAIPVEYLTDKAKEMEVQIHYSTAVEKAIPTPDILNEMMAIEEVFMIGYPDGLWDEKHNLPLVRKGITATNMAIDYNGQPEFLVDIATFQGSSGSPIIVYNPGPYQTKKSIKLGGRIYFMGILYAGPLFEIEGNVKLAEEEFKADDNLITLAKIPMNLGHVVKSHKILDFKPILAKLKKHKS